MIRSLPPPTSWSAALVATAIGFGGTIALVARALRHVGAAPDQVGSAITALCIAIALVGAALSVRLRMPVILAWSTPGAAVLLASPATSWPAACGAFVVAGLIAASIGAVPALGRLASAIPPSIASALLAGILLPFGLEAFRQADSDLPLLAALTVTFLAARRRLPAYALLLVLAVGLAITCLRQDAGTMPAGAVLGSVQLMPVRFEIGAVLGLAIPLALVTLVSQNLPGIAVLQWAGYASPPAPLLGSTGLASIAAAPFGAHGINLAAITAALCTGPDADADAARRWRTGLIYAGFYLLLALLSPVFVRYFLVLPDSAIAILTGIAIVPALTGSLASTVAAESHRDASILVLLVTASGVSLFGIGSAFWGIVAGLCAMTIGGIVRGRHIQT